MNGNDLILLVDDNPDDEELTQLAFGKARITSRVVVVRDGAEALAYLFATGAWADRSPADDPCLVLLDLNLPKIGGLEVLRQLRANPRTSLLPVVILTSSVEEQDVVRGYKLGCNSYIRKPVDFTQFIEAIKTLSLYWLVLNERPLKGEGG